MPESRLSVNRHKDDASIGSIPAPRSVFERRSEMYPRTNYEMTEADLKTLLDACKATVCIMVGSYVPRTPQEKANDAWRALGMQMGFDYTTVRPIEGKGQRFFSAVPSETQEQQKEREKREAVARVRAEIWALESEIADRQSRLNALRNGPALCF